MALHLDSHLTGGCGLLNLFKVSDFSLHLMQIGDKKESKGIEEGHSTLADGGEAAGTALLMME